ncbi:MAG: MerR family transcriptional regulator [Pedobacter sp.]|nr:MAG: MerR family transcriptional regulator [Pedobacter sp.]
MSTEPYSTYSIKDLEQLTGIKAHTIRIWEKRYGVIAPGRTDTNIRYYSNEDLKKLLNIGLLNQHGYKISDISDMTEEEVAEKITSISLTQHDDFEDRLMVSILDLDEVSFSKIIERLIIRHGFEGSMVNHIFPFLGRIGIMWQIGTINPAQEHFFSNLIRNKIIAATEQLPVSNSSQAKVVVLFLPEGELHEIGLLFYNYAFRKRGYKTIYLGQSVPYKSLERVYDTIHPSIVVTSVTNPTSPEAFSLACADICHQAENAKVYFAGPLPEKILGTLPPNARLSADLKKLLST